MNNTETNNTKLNKAIQEHITSNTAPEPAIMNINNDNCIFDLPYDFLDKKMKSDFKIGIEYWLHHYQKKYRSYFVTFTFHQPNYVIERETRRFFNQMVNRLNNKLCVKNHDKSAVFILYPE